MKKTILIILALALSFAASYAAKWESYGPTNTPSYITSINGVVYCITPGSYSSNSSYDIFRSSDDGNNWGRTCDVKYYCNIYSIKGAIYADNTSTDSIFVSYDNGLHWTIIKYDLNIPNRRAIYTVNDSIFSSTNDGIYLSIDNCATWSKIKNSVPKSFYSNFFVQNNIAYASGYGCIYKGNLNDTNWTKINLDSTLSKFDCKLTTNGRYLIVYSLYEALISTDAGYSWNKMIFPSKLSIKSCCFDGNKCFVSSEEGVYFSSDLGQTWSAIQLMNGNMRMENIVANEDYCVSISDKSNVYTSENQGVNWNCQPYTENYGVACSGDTIVLASTNHILNYSVDRGIHFNKLPGYFNGSSTISIVNGTLYAGDNGVIKTFKFGDTAWKTLNVVTKFDENLFFNYEGELFGLMSNEIVKSTDAGLTWNKINKTNMFGYKICFNDGNFFIGGRPIIDPKSDDYGYGVYKSSDKGVTWDTVNTGLTNRTITGLTARYGNIYASCGTGVFMSSNNGANWICINDSLVKFDVLDLSSNSEYLFAATGWVAVGVARLKLPSSLPGVVLEYPYNQSTQININTPLRWYSVGEALRYTMQISKDPNFTSLVSEQECADSLFNISGLENYTKYYWRVKATFGAVKGQWSEVFNFTTGDINKVEELIASKFSVSPNPASQSLNLDYVFSEQGDLSITLYNVVGEKVLELIGMSPAGRQNVDVSKLAAGAYQVVFELSGKKLYYPVTIVR